MDAMQILVIILSVFLAIFLVLGIILTIQLIKVTKQIRTIADSTKSAVDKVNNFAASAARLTSPALIASLVGGQIKKFMKRKERK